MIKINQLFLTLSIISFSTICFGMEDQTMQTLNKWNDVTSFVGKVVLYTTHDEGFTQQNYTLGKYSVGYFRVPDKKIEDYYKSSQAYTLLRLFQPRKWSSGWIRLTDSCLEHSKLKMREATTEERKKILEAVTNNKAKLDYFHDEFVQNLQTNEL